MTASVRPATGPDVRGRTAWAASFLGFPTGGSAAIAAVGRVDSPTAALVGGALTGVVVGGAQVLATRALRDRGRRLPPVAWIAATTVGTAVGVGARRVRGRLLHLARRAGAAGRADRRRPRPAAGPRPAGRG